MSKKRGNGEGSITKRKDGRWMARYTVHTAKGPKRRHVYGKTRKEAADKLAKVLSDRVEGIVYDDENTTVGEYLDAWLKGAVRGSIRQSTYDRDAYLVENHVKPVLGRIRLKNLSSAHVQGFYRDRLDSGLSASTVHKIHTVLHKALARAVAWQMIPRNVTDAVEPPRPAPREMCPLSPAEARKLLGAAQGESLEALYVLAVHTGMRQGELLALKWQDIDLENATVSVRRTLTRSGGIPHDSASSRRNELGVKMCAARGSARSRTKRSTRSSASRDSRQTPRSYAGSLVSFMTTGRRAIAHASAART